MLSDEERELIEGIQKGNKIGIYELIRTFKREGIENFITVRRKYIDIMINLIEKQSKEIEHQKEKRENQKKELAILNAKQIEFNKLVNTVNSYKGQFKRQQKEIEELKDNNKQKYYHVVKSKELEEEINNAWENKIKAKIEELDKQEKEVLKGTKGQDRYSIKQEYMHKRSVLQSLLEKE